MKWLFIILIIFIIISIILFVLYKKFNELQIKIYNAKNELEKINKNINEKDNQLSSLSNKLSTTQEILKNKKADLVQTTEVLGRLQTNTEESFTNYCKILDKSYQEKEQEYDEAVQLLKESYDKQQDKILAEAALCREELDKISATRAAAIQAQLKEKEIKEQLSYYCLQVTPEDLDDIQALERVKPKLHNQRILCMLIWSTYFQKSMTNLCDRILGLNTVCGIYKITNQETNECYIGQAVDMAKRWKDHAKCGLGIDTPVNNKLYKAMQEYGIWNFSWELLEKCTSANLNEKEAYYIELYQSKSYGYNSSAGIRK